MNACRSSSSLLEPRICRLILRGDRKIASNRALTAESMRELYNPARKCHCHGMDDERDPAGDRGDQAAQGPLLPLSRHEGLAGLARALQRRLHRRHLGGRRPTVQGADEFVAFTRKNIGKPSQPTVHQVHAPEIELTSPTTANGVWALNDIVRLTYGLNLNGFGHYHETYEKIDGQWYITSSTR